MDAPPPDLPDGRRALVSRRRLLWLAGSAGLGAASIAACTTWPGREAAGQPTGTSNTPSSTATPTAGTSPTTTPPPQPMTPAVAPANPVSTPKLCRASWGAQDPRPGGTPHKLTKMTIHHTAVVLGDNSDAPARLRQHQQYHQNQHGWIDIAYHVGVDRNGNIYDLRKPELVGDTATNYDPTGHFLVLCEGDFDQEEVSEAQLNGAALAFAWAAQSFEVAPETLKGHRDYASTACPGANLYARVKSGDLRRRVDDLLAAGPVNLQDICGAEAAAIVADIEAGRH